MSTSTTIIFMINLSSPYFFGSMLVWMNAFGTYRTMISFPSYTSTVTIKEISLQWYCGTLSILPWQLLSSWFSTEHHSSLEFFCCAIFLQYNYSLLIPSIIMWRQFFNRNRLKKFAYIVGPSNLSAYQTLLIQTFKTFMQRIPLRKYFALFHYIISKVLNNTDNQLQCLSEYYMRLLFSSFLDNTFWFTSVFVFDISSSNLSHCGYSISTGIIYLIDHFTPI